MGLLKKRRLVKILRSLGDDEKPGYERYVPDSDADLPFDIFIEKPKPKRQIYINGWGRFLLSNADFLKRCFSSLPKFSIIREKIPKFPRFPKFGKKISSIFKRDPIKVKKDKKLIDSIIQELEELEELEDLDY